MNARMKYQRPMPGFAKILDQFINEELPQWSKMQNTIWNSNTPAVNIYEDENGFQLTLAAPGYEKSDFKIEVKDDVLTISSEKTTEPKENEKGRFARQEFNYGKFSRNFNLPESIDGSKISADYKAGVLSLTLPKKEEAKPQPARTISVE